MVFAVSFPAQNDSENVFRTFETFEFAKLLQRESWFLYGKKIQICKRLNRDKKYSSKIDQVKGRKFLQYFSAGLLFQTKMR